MNVPIFRIPRLASLCLPIVKKHSSDLPAVEADCRVESAFAENYRWDFVQDRLEGDYRPFGLNVKEMKLELEPLIAKYVKARFEAIKLSVVNAMKELELVNSIRAERIILPDAEFFFLFDYMRAMFSHPDGTSPEGTRMFGRQLESGSRARVESSDEFCRWANIDLSNLPTSFEG